MFMFLCSFCCYIVPRISSKFASSYVMYMMVYRVTFGLKVMPEHTISFLWIGSYTWGFK